MYNRKVAQTVWFSLILLFCILMVFPFIWMTMISFKRPLELILEPNRIIPRTMYLKNYILILGAKYRYYILFINSIKISVINVVGNLVTSSLAGYAFARLKFKGRDFFFLLILATLMIPPQVTIIPRFILFHWMGLVDTHYSLILPGLFSVIGTFMMRQFFLQIPFELSESAYIDGASEYRTFFQVIFPLAKPAIISIIVINFTWHWNDFQNPLIFLRSQKLFTIPLGLNFFAEENDTQLELVATASVLSSLPMIVVFIIAQRHFITGLTSGGIKG